MKKTIITISRETGSGGHSIGKMLADRLGYAFYDKEFVAEVARETGIDAETILQNGEYMAEGAFFERAIGIAPVTRSGKIPYEEIKRVQDGLIRRIAEKGNCVIVGRGADYILRNDPRALHVFIHASMDYRVRRVQEKDGLTGQEARIRKELEVKDRSRGTYYQYYTDRKWGKVANYHLVLDAGLFGQEQCCDMICGALAYLNGREA